jgi:Flp pilus assembly protein TadG
MDNTNCFRPVRTRNATRVARSGAAVIEFAVCLPVIMATVLGAMETCSVIFLRQTLQATAYEAVRMAVDPNATTATVQSRADEMLREQHVHQGTVQFSPSDVATAAPGSSVTVVATAPLDANRLMPQWFFGPSDITVSCVMLKEGTRMVRVEHGVSSGRLLSLVTCGVGP